MVALPLAHVSWSLLDNAARKACDTFLVDVFGAEAAFEMLLTPEMEKTGFDREETLFVIGDTMLIPIAPAGPGEKETSPLGNMLRRMARPHLWLGVSLRCADLKAADAWLRAKGFTPRYDPGMENNYLLIHRKEALGVRVEIMVGELPNDPRLKPDWAPQRWRDAHPLGIEGLQSIGVSTPDLATARALFAERFEWPELSRRQLADEGAECASFLVGDTVIEAMAPLSDASPLAAHARDVKGIYCLTFKVRSNAEAAAHLRNKGLPLVGDVTTRFAIDPARAFGRMIYFTEQTIDAYPPLGSKLRTPGVFPALG